MRVFDSRRGTSPPLIPVRRSTREKVTNDLVAERSAGVVASYREALNPQVPSGGSGAIFPQPVALTNGRDGCQTTIVGRILKRKHFGALLKGIGCLGLQAESKLRLVNRMEVSNPPAA